MAYLGSKLDDYFAYQLIDKVIEQVENDEIEYWYALKESLKRLEEKIKEKEKEINCFHNIK